jgi:hypothetical protein
VLLLACFLSLYPLDGKGVFQDSDNGFSEHTTLKMIESEVASIKFSKLNGIPVVKVKSHW